ncbi:MAG: prepilin-type N-terminal cleavage/methylation domain-containing protein [Candidatus Gracilibacteria bacterium]|nr:prepilin-type N-terminal cleavage/methylation domain-containing protein [Candidatus Gracilibacteria bacterium]
MDSKNKIKRAFSLIELIVGITISMILMVSIGVFVSSGMQNIFLQQKSLTNASDLNDFASDIYETLGSIENSGSLSFTSSGVIFKRQNIFDKGGFTYIGSETLNGYYCDDVNSEDTKTKHIFIKNFIPFFEIGEDITTNNYLTGSVNHKGNIYISYQKEHKVTDNLGNTIIGRGIFGDKFEEGSSATGIYLNSPTGIASDGEMLYVSDTLNNRILYLSGSNIYSLLDESDGLNEPTGLYFDIAGKVLYIANSGNGEILKFSSESVIVPNKIFTFSGVTENNIETIYINFFNNNINYNINSLDINTSFNNDEASDEKAFNNNIFSYGFMSGAIHEPVNFVGTNTYTIGLSNLIDFSTPGNYTIKLIIGSSEKEFYYFTQGDGKIYTKTDNKLEIVRSGLDYPNGIWGNPGTNISPNNSNFKEFNSSIGNLNIDTKNDIILNNPIDNLDISKNGNLLNLILKHYRNYNCFNLDENKEKINTFLSKVMLK